MDILSAASTATTTTSTTTGPAVISRYIHIFCSESDDTERNIQNQEDAFQGVCQIVAQNNVLLLGLIVQLERYLTSEQDKVRSKATLLLARLLEMQGKPLTPSQIHHFCVFFSSRVSDYPSLSPCLRALRGLVQHQWQHIDEKYMDVPYMFDTVFSQLEVRELPQSVRSRVFELLITLLSLDSVVAQVQHLGQRVIQGVLDAAEGEKDPRCLVLCFRLVALLYSGFKPSLLLCQDAARSAGTSGGKDDWTEMEQDTEDRGNRHGAEEEEGEDFSPSSVTLGERIFNIMACYFPITFNPPPGDPYGVTPPMLIQALKHALCDSQHVASFTVPFLLDQILAPPETVCRSHAIFYLHYLLSRHGAGKQAKGQSALPSSLVLVIGQLSESLYDIALEDTTSLPTVVTSTDSREAHDAASRSTLTDQAVDLIGLICKHIGNAASSEGEALWTQFCEPIIAHIVKNTRKSVQNLVTKANMKVVMAMASSTYKVTTTVIDRLFPVLLQHVQPTLEAEMRSIESREGGGTEDLLQHDLERREHDRNSAAVALMYLAQMISCTQALDLNFSQYLKSWGKGGQNPDQSSSGLVSLYADLYTLLSQYALKFFRYSSLNFYDLIARSDRSSVGLYAGSLRCLQTLLAIKLLRSSGGGDTEDSEEVQLLREVSLNCLVVRSSASESYDWSADVRQASMLYVAECRRLYARQGLMSSGTEVASLSSVFLEGCLNVFKTELSLSRSSEHVDNIFRAISFLLQPFSSATVSDNTAPKTLIETETAKADKMPWSSLDSQLLGIILSCISSSSAESYPEARGYALRALMNCLPLASATSSSTETNPIVMFLVSIGSDKDKLSNPSTNFQALLEYALGSRSDEDSLSVVCQIVHRVLASLSASRLDADLARDTQLVIEAGLDLCISALASHISPSATIFSLSDLFGDCAVLPVISDDKFLTRNKAASVLLAVLNVLDKDCWVWTYTNAIDASASDNRFSILWAQLLNILFSESIVKDVETHTGAAKQFSETCSRLLAVVLNKSLIGENLELVLCGLEHLIISCTLSPSTASTLSLSARDSAVELLVLVTRALCMRRNVVKTKKSSRDQVKTWQDVFLQILLDILLASRSVPGSYQSEMLLLVAKHIPNLSCEHKNEFLSVTFSNNTNMMWRQKVWHRCFSVLTAVVHQASTESTEEEEAVQSLAYLLCLCGLAAEMPVQVVQDNMVQLITFSVQALMVNDPASALLRALRSGEGTGAGCRAGGDYLELVDHVQRYLRQSAVQCLLASCQSTESSTIDTLSPHISTLIPLLLQTAQADARTTLASSRASSVQCLFYIAGGDMCRRFQYHTLHPLKRLVVKGLSTVLDDNKKAVRRWAAKVRNLWIALKEV